MSFLPTAFLSIVNCQLLIVIFSFLAIWFAARLIITTVSSFAHLLHLSSFAVSFFILGLATSLPEFFISTSGVLDRQPEIAAGTLYGATIVIFLFIIPFLSIISGGLSTNHQLKPKTLAFSLFVIFLPFIFGLDGRFERQEAVVMIAAYFMLFYMVEKRQGFLEKVENSSARQKKAEAWDLIKIVFGALILFVAAKALVAQTINLAGVYKISPFLISILILSLGADLPEVALAVLSALKKTKSIAMGDYLGSASANTLIFGALTLVNGQFAFADENYIFTFGIFLTGLSLFWIFARSKRNLSRAEASVLLLIYAVFIEVKLFM